MKHRVTNHRCWHPCYISAMAQVSSEEKSQEPCLGYPYEDCRSSRNWFKRHFSSKSMQPSFFLSSIYIYIPSLIYFIFCRRKGEVREKLNWILPLFIHLSQRLRKGKPLYLSLKKKKKKKKKKVLCRSGLEIFLGLNLQQLLCQLLLKIKGCSLSRTNLLRLILLSNILLLLQGYQ